MADFVNTPSTMSDIKGRKFAKIGLFLLLFEEKTRPSAKRANKRLRALSEGTFDLKTKIARLKRLRSFVRAGGASIFFNEILNGCHTAF
ncbi:MAG: hypothetical protein J6C93_06180 [Clostridia bacterium]|nr:hypothetical protein [Clostridia bacterium]